MTTSASGPSPRLPNAAQLLALLRENNFLALEEHLSEAQSGYEYGEVKEAEYNDMLLAFNTADQHLGKHFEAWFDRDPESYSAHLAAAHWLLALGWAARGGQTANKVSDSGWRRLGGALEQAQELSSEALALSAKPLHAWYVKASVACTHGCRLSEEDLATRRYPEWYEGGVKCSPNSLLMRQRMLTYLRTEWGGSEEMMLEFMRQQEKDGLVSADDLRRLWAMFHANVAHYERYFAGNATKAVERAQLAAELDKRYEQQLFEMKYDAGAPQAELQTLLENILAHPEHHKTFEVNFYGALYGARTWLAPYVPQLSERIVQLAQTGDQDAALALGRFCYLAPNLPWPEPRPWLERAREAGNMDAAEMLVLLQDNSSTNGPINQFGAKAGTEQKALAPQLREDIVRAAEMGQPDMCERVLKRFREFQSHYGWQDHEYFRFALIGADAGNDNLRVTLSSTLRKGTVALEGDGEIVPHGDFPNQRSLDYAKHLLERAAAAGNRVAQEDLERLPNWVWNEQEVRRRGLEAAQGAATPAASKAPPPSSLGRHDTSAFAKANSGIMQQSSRTETTPEPQLSVGDRIRLFFMNDAGGTNWFRVLWVGALLSGLLRACTQG